MVWSDNSQFPFFVIDNSGNIILTIDETGLHLVGSQSRLDALINSGNALIQLSNIINPNLVGRLALRPIGGTNYIQTIASNAVGDTAQVLIGTNGTIFIQGSDAGGVLNGPIVYLDQNYIELRPQFGGSGKTLRYDKTTGFFIVVAQDWTTCPLFNGWTVSGGRPLQMKMSVDGRVYMRGTLLPGTVGNIVFATVPFAQWNPSQFSDCHVASDNAPVNIVRVDNTGLVTMYNAVAGGGYYFGSESYSLV